jgi:hypothetical protein
MPGIVNKGGIMHDDNENGARSTPDPQTEPSSIAGEIVADCNVQESNQTRPEMNAPVVPKKPVSSRKAQANRNNARNSTGPKTAAGKKTVAKNAIKHGFYSRWLLVANEDQREFAELYIDIIEQYQPVRWREKDLVDKIAAWSWRLRRLVRHESGNIALSLASHSYDLRSVSETAPGEPGSRSTSSPEMDAMTDHLFFTSEGVENRLRFEAMINRQLNLAIAELERVQARRLSEKSATASEITKQSQELV